MTLALALVKLSPQATKGLVEEGPAARAEYYRKTMEAAGSNVLGYYIAEGGEWDVVILVDFADDQLGARGVATILSTQATGLWAKSQMIRLHNPEDVQAALAHATPLRHPGSSD